MVKKIAVSLAFIFWGAGLFLAGYITGGWVEWERGANYMEKCYVYHNNGLKHPDHYRAMQIAGAGSEGPSRVYGGR